MNHLDRRQVLAVSAAAAGVYATSSFSLAARKEESAPSKLKILILGGTGFLGPALVEAAKPHGHEVVLFNRGKTNPSMFPELEKLRGDRDPKKGEGLKSLEGRAFDVVFDDSGYFPRHVDASAEILKKSGTKHYVFVSSISCYAANNVIGADESAACGQLADPTVESMGAQYENYGPLKAACEEAARKHFGEATTIVRPGFIVGPGDPTDRFTYWPVRFSKGGTALVPGGKDDPVQVIDVRDLAEWMIHLAEQRTMGVYNACGPKERLAFSQLIEACMIANSTAKTAPRWVPLEELQKLGGLDLPIWVPYTDETRGFHTWSNAKAVEKGLRFRTIQQTVNDTLVWWNAQSADRRAKPRAGLSAEQEAAALAKLG